MNEVWDLSILYKDFDDPAFTGDMKALDEAIAAVPPARSPSESKAADGERAVHHQCLEPSGSMGSASAEAWDACVREGLFDAADTAERCRNGSNGESLRNSAGNTAVA